MHAAGTTVPRDRSTIDTDTDKIDEAVLALLYLTLHDGYRARTGHDWDALSRSHQKGMISDPVGKANSVVFTQEGLVEGERWLQTLFEKPVGWGRAASIEAGPVPRASPAY